MSQLNLSEHTHAECNFCEDLHGNPVWHPWWEFEYGSIPDLNVENKYKEVCWCIHKWSEYKHCIESVIEDMKGTL